MKVLALILIYCCMFLILLSCNNQPDFGPPPVVVPRKTIIAASLRPYVDSFVDEAAKRNIKIDIEKEGFTMEFANLRNTALPLADGVAYTEKALIQIHDTFSTWTEDYKKLVIYHELGHLLLKRQHNFDYLPNGEVKSIMWPGGKCETTFFTGKDRISYYINELFDPNNNTTPVWTTDESINNNYKIPVKKSQIFLLDLEKLASNETLKLDLGANKNIQFINSALSISNTSDSFLDIDLEKYVKDFAQLNVKNYEIAIKYIPTKFGISCSWNINRGIPAKYFVTPYACDATKSFGISYQNLFFSTTESIKQNLNAENEIVLRYKENRIWIFINQKLAYESDFENIFDSNSPKLILRFYSGNTQLTSLKAYEISKEIN